MVISHKPGSVSAVSVIMPIPIQNYQTLFNHQTPRYPRCNLYFDLAMFVAAPGHPWIPRFNAHLPAICGVDQAETGSGRTGDVLLDLYVFGVFHNIFGIVGLLFSLELHSSGCFKGVPKSNPTKSAMYDGQD